MPKSGQKNVNSVITIISEYPKKSIGFTFFQIFNEKPNDTTYWPVHMGGGRHIFLQATLRYPVLPAPKKKKSIIF